MLKYLNFIDNLSVSGSITKVGEIRAALQAKFNLDRLSARKIAMEWLKSKKMDK